MRLSKYGCLIAAMALLAAVSGIRAQEQPADPGFMKSGRQLVYDGRRSGEAYFSGDGKYLIFQSERDEDNPFYQIYILDLETGDVHRVSPGQGKTTCAFFRPDSDLVLFASTHLDPRAVDKQKEEIEFRASGKSRRYSWDYDEHFDIFTARRDGGEVTRLTDTPGYDAEGSYSPGGDRIVFASVRDAYPIDALDDADRKRIETDTAYFAEIYIMNADGSDPVRLTNWPGYDGGPFFSPDGTRIVWRHFEEGGMIADVYTMRPDGSDKRRLTDFESMSWAPFYHPSGEYVIFTSNKFGFSNFELFMVDAAGSKQPVRVTAEDGFDGLPAFSPSGTRLAWTCTRTSSGKSQIFIADWDHAAAGAAIAAAPPRVEEDTHTFATAITAADLRANVEYLASDRLEGRLTGTRGTAIAADYISQRLVDAGVGPALEGGAYYQPFPFTSGMNIIEKGNRLEVTSDGGTHGYDVNVDFRPLSFSSNGEAEGDVVFAGYGLTVPGKMGEGYDSYSGLDVKDKIALVLRYVPEGVDVERRQELNLYAGLRYKAMIARENGAKALLVITGPNSPNAGDLVPLKFDQSLANSGIVVASVSDKVAAQLFAGAKKSLQEAQSGLDEENPHFEGAFDLPGARVKIATELEREEKTGRNVVGILPPSDPAIDSYVMIGAHYDHIGHGVIGSLAHKGEEGQIHNGADDNASGTSLVLELAASLADERTRNPDAFKHGVIIALWSGEELGVIGSSYFAEHPPVPIDNIVAYFNFDMVGRLRDNNLIVQGVGSSGEWTKRIEKRNVAAGFNLTLQEDPYLPTDVTAFYPKGVPVLSFFTGSHEDYNRPTDDAATLDYDAMERIANFARSLVIDVAGDPGRPDYAKVERSKAEAGGREMMRVYLGTIPDYATSGVEGVKLSGVRAGGPADKAGLRGGDVIVELAGQKITNIYDYTYALDALKIGEPAEIVVLRDDGRVALTIVPEARQ